MAVLNSEWLLLLRPSTNPLQTQHQQSAIILVSSSTPRAPARRFSIACSAGPSSSLLEEASNEVQFVHFLRRNTSPSSSPSSSSSATAPYRRARTVRPQLVPDPDDAAKDHDVRPCLRPQPDGFTKDELAESPGADALAFEYYNKAKLHPGFRPDHRLLRNVVRYLLRSRDWAAVPALAADFRTLGVFPDRATCARLIGACVRARKFRAAESILTAIEDAAPQGKRQQQVAVAAYGVAMRGYNRLHMYTSAVAVHERMVRAGIVPDEACCCAAMDAHRKLGNADKVVALFQEFVGASNNNATAAATGSFANNTYARKAAADQVSRMYMILCDSLARSKRPFEALRYFREMTDERGIPPDQSIYGSLISSFAAAKEAEITEDLFKEASDRGLVKDPALFLKLVLMYVDTGEARKTIQVVKEMQDMSIPVTDCVLCAVVNGHVKKGGLRAAARAYEDLIALGCSPGQVTYSSAINVYCRLGLSAKVESLFKEMLSRGYDRCVVAYSNIMSMYGRAGRVRDATRLLAQMKARGCEPNVWVYNALIDMHGRRAGGAEDLRQIRKLWKEMRRRKVEPDRVTYTSVIAAYTKAREFTECVECYKEFRDTGGRADRALAAIMVGVFSRTSRVEELIQLLQDIKAEGIIIDERLYMSALNALRDTGLQMQVKWFSETFAYANPKSRAKTLMAVPADAADLRQQTISAASSNSWTRSGSSR